MARALHMCSACFLLCVYRRPRWILSFIWFLLNQCCVLWVAILCLCSPNMCLSHVLSHWFEITSYNFPLKGHPLTTFLLFQFLFPRAHIAETKHFPSWISKSADSNYAARQYLPWLFWDAHLFTRTFSSDKWKKNFSSRCNFLCRNEITPVTCPQKDGLQLSTILIKR